MIIISSPGILKLAEKNEQKGAPYCKTSLQELLFAKGVQSDPVAAAREVKELQTLRNSVAELENQLAGQSSDLFKRAVSCLKEENYLDAMGFLQAVCYLQPENLKAMNNLGLVYFELGYKDRSREMFERVLVLNPQNERARKNLVILE